jgi:hypothetical protein
VYLTAATYYKYTVYPTGVPQEFKVRFCRGAGFPDCWQLGKANMNRSYFSHTTVGGEGNCSGTADNCPIGYIAARQNFFLQWKDNKWYSYCYTETHFDIDTSYSWHFSACGPGPEWTLHYR